MNLLSEAHIRRIYVQGPPAVVRLVHRLADRIEELEAQPIREPQPVIARLSKELAQAKRTLAHKSQELIEQHQLNHQLLNRIRELEHEVERGTSVVRDSHNSNERPDRVITHAPEACPDCGSSLAATDVIASERRQVFDLPPARLSVTGHRRETRRCPACGVTSRAEFPAGVRAPVQYGPRLLTHAAYLNLYQLLPVARTSEALSDLFGCAPSTAIIGRAGRVFAEKLVRCEQRIKAAIRDSEVVGADETGLRVAGANGYIHAARTEALTHFAYDSRRGRDAMQEIGILPQFKGTLVRDGYLSYSRFERCRHALCNAHLLRDLVFVEETSPAQKVWTKPLAALLIEIKEAAEKARAAGQEQLGEESKGAFLRRYDRLLRKADRLDPHPPPGDTGGPPKKKRPALSPQRRLANRLLRRRDEVLRFMSDLAVPFTNNGTGRDLRMVKVQQKIGGCFRTEAGARDFCRVRSYLSTARKQGHSLLSALERALAGKPLPLVTSPET